MAGFCLKLLNELLREAVGEGGQRVRADHTGDLPVADGGILAHALLLQAGEGADGGGILLPDGHTVDVEQSEFFQVGAVEVGKYEIQDGFLLSDVLCSECDDRFSDR